MVPVVEGLLERGHNVTMIIPNTTEAHGWFPAGIGAAQLVFVGDEDASFSSIKIPDMKNLQWHERILAWGRIVWNYRSMVDKPFFSVLDDFVTLIQHNSFDAAFSSAISIGCNAALKRSDIPWVAFMSVPPFPELVLSDSEEVCKYPNMLNPRSVPDLRTSLVLRVRNRIECMMLQAYIKFGFSVMNSVLRDRGYEPAEDYTKILLGAPTNIMLGGPPLTLPIKLPSGSHVVGTVERQKPRSLPTELGRWLDDAGTSPVIYVSMGTKYEFTNSSGSKLMKELSSLMEEGFRILWSLRASQQQALQHLLPPASHRLQIEEFTPQPEVLAHPAVKAFFSHCGWGGVTDTLAAGRSVSKHVNPDWCIPVLRCHSGVPVLAYPSFSDQRGNAQRLVEIGAAVTLG